MPYGVSVLFYTVHFKRVVHSLLFALSAIFFPCSACWQSACDVRASCECSLVLRSARAAIISASDRAAWCISPHVGHLLYGAVPGLRWGPGRPGAESGQRLRVGLGWSLIGQ